MLYIPWVIKYTSRCIESGRAPWSISISAQFLFGGCFTTLFIHHNPIIILLPLSVFDLTPPIFCMLLKKLRTCAIGLQSWRDVRSCQPSRDFNKVDQSSQWRSCPSSNSLSNFVLRVSWNSHIQLLGYRWPSESCLRVVTCLSSSEVSMSQKMRLKETPLPRVMAYILGTPLMPLKVWVSIYLCFVT